GPGSQSQDPSEYARLCPVQRKKVGQGHPRQQDHRQLSRWRAAPATPMPTRSSDTLPALERFLTYRMHVVNKVSDRDSNRAYQETCGLPLGEARCLAAIGRYAPLSVNDLARAANLNKGQASRSAQALVDRGLVNKAACENDARGVLLAPTRAGQALYER